MIAQVLLDSVDGCLAQGRRGAAAGEFAAQVDSIGVGSCREAAVPTLVALPDCLAQIESSSYTLRPVAAFALFVDLHEFDFDATDFVLEESDPAFGVNVAAGHLAGRALL